MINTATGSTTSTTNNASLQVYAGDEITSVIIDPGSYTTNIGISGLDYPQIQTPSSYGIQSEEESDTGSITDKKKNDNSRKFFNEQSLLFPRKDYEINRVVENGMILNWDVAEEQWSYFLEKELYLPSTKGVPCFLSEPIWNTEDNRKKSLEVLLESMQFEAMFLAPTPTCLSFAMGRANCLVVDIGHDCCSASPVLDGLTLSKSTRRNFFAGNFLNELLKEKIIDKCQNSTKIKDLIPLFKIKQKSPELILKKFDFDIHPSLINYGNERGFLQECKETLLQAVPGLKNDLPLTASRLIESPWGETIEFTNEERYELPNQLFDPTTIPANWPIDANGVVETWHNDYIPLKRNNNKQQNTETQDDTATPAPDTDSTLPSATTAARNNGDERINDISGLVDIVYASIMDCDVDVRGTLAHNIVVTGGTSYIPGLVDKLQTELSKKLPALKLRTLTSGTLNERVYQSWLGGSILTSLGTFHQLWVGKEEYNEVGADRLLKTRFR
ncbi:related to Actin-related protein 4 [Saccharomycodes ludwigii]|uniref:Actin-related protein 4 n=1 Tax=Saccharomycodes ludwigii TaxID=36035 RepID=A0A376B8R8_9ASCO|nr:related to Actin-related protein 4 [Saccharomycodes ludwigii]